MQVPDVGGIVERLLVFLDSSSEDVVAEALVQMKDLLRRYPDMAEVGHDCLYKLSKIWYYFFYEHPQLMDSAGRILLFTQTAW